jgi:hypothetical protein
MCDVARTPEAETRGFLVVTMVNRDDGRAYVASAWQSAARQATGATVHAPGSEVSQLTCHNQVSADGYEMAVREMVQTAGAARLNRAVASHGARALVRDHADRRRSATSLAN